jgi:hypothetical protein
MLQHSTAGPAAVKCILIVQQKHTHVHACKQLMLRFLVSSGSLLLQIFLAAVLI